MAGQQITCALAGCNKPPWPSAVGCATPHLTCGNLHHQLLMAGRFHPSLPPPFQAILNRNTARLCALLSCQTPPCSGHSWCSRSHYLLWLAQFTASLHPDQICKLPGCTRHVFVDDEGSRSEFCGWEHQQKFVTLRALDQRQEAQLLSLKAGQYPQEGPPSSPAPSIESDCGRRPSLNSLMHSLKQFALSEVPPKNIRVVEDFYEKHPWEVYTEEGHACWVIARLKFTSKGRKLTTKGHYHWKQSGPRDKKKSKLYTGTYYTYKRRKGKEEEGQLHEERSFTMKEYTMTGVQWYSLIDLVKEKPSCPQIAREQPAVVSEQHIGIEVNSHDSWPDEDILNFFWKDEVNSKNFWKDDDILNYDDARVVQLHRFG